MALRFGKVGRYVAVGTIALVAPVVGVLAPTAAGAAVPAVIVSEVAPWASGSSPYAADWFELTNNDTVPVTLTNWRMDDSSPSFATAVVLNGVTTLQPGQSAIFVEGNAATATSFTSTWFGASPPAGFQIGFYSGSGVGLSTSGDAVNIYDSTGTLITGVTFGASDAVSPFQSFDNTAGVNGAISTLSTTGTNGAFVAANDAAEIGSPGTIGAPGPVVPEVPYAIILPAGAIALLGVGVVVQRRRRAVIA